MHEDNHNEPVLASHMHMESSHPLLLLGMLLPSMVSRKGREPRGGYGATITCCPHGNPALWTRREGSVTCQPKAGNFGQVRIHPR